jgi:hypothetical protein
VVIGGGLIETSLPELASGDSAGLLESPAIGV